MQVKFLVCLTLILFLISPTAVLAAPPKLDVPEVAEKTPEMVDPRVLILTDYLSTYNSPLKDHAQDFIDAADQYGVDWRLVPAISGVESIFGKRIPGGHNPDTTSYNGWGWGVYGTKILSFNSWKDGIFAVTKGLKNNYIDKGLQDPYAMNAKYASADHWGESVDFFLNDLAQFASLYQVPPIVAPKINPEDNEIFQNDAYLKVEKDHFSLVFVEQN